MISFGQEIRVVRVIDGDTFVKKVENESE